MSDARRILVVGGGGREHALCWRIHRDRPTAELFAAPGNGGTAELATNVPIRVERTAVITPMSSVFLVARATIGISSSFSN